VLLLEEFRRQYAGAGRPDLLLTTAVPGPQQAGLFNMPEAHPLLDWVALMTYDLWGSWKPLSGHHTSLYNSEYDPQPVEQRASADSTVRLYRDSFGVPPEKILLGAAFYGRGWGEVGPAHHGLYQPGQTLTGMGSNYYDLLDYQKAGFERHWDEDAQAPWLYSPSRKIFFSYDDPQSLALKAGYAREHGLGGVMFWEISADDPAGTLVDALDRGLRA
jgi:chitinase